MLAIGYNGPILLEDAKDLAAIAIATGKMVKPSLWVDEWRLRAEADNLAANFGA